MAETTVPSSVNAMGNAVVRLKDLAALTGFGDFPQGIVVVLYLRKQLRSADQANQGLTVPVRSRYLG